MIKNNTFSGMFCQVLSKIYKLTNTARVQNIPAFLQNPTLDLFLQFRWCFYEQLTKKTGLRNFVISICIRIHMQNHDAHLSFKALHQIMCSLHESVPKVPGRTLKVYIFFVQLYSSL